MDQLESVIKDHEVSHLREVLKEREKEIDELRKFVSTIVEDNNDLYTKAIDHFGQINQINQLVEECAELIFTINKWRRGVVKEDAISEEIADVGIMLEQISSLFNPEKINAFRIEKLAKLKARLEA